MSREMRVVVIGSGYVGLVTAVGLCAGGHRVAVVDVDREKVDAIASGRVPFFEPGLEPILRGGLNSGRLTCTTELDSVLRGVDVVMIAVGTPPELGGRADLSQVFAAVRSVGAGIDGPCVVAMKSTVPVGTSDAVEATLGDAMSARSVTFEVDVVSNPEFLREGTAVKDFLEPERIVVGTDSPRAVAVMRELYEPFCWSPDAFVAVSRRSSEMSKYAANAMLATRISFMNEIARLSDACGADVNDVRQVMGMDSRIGSRYLMPGAGFGGSCFPKDLRALIATGEDHGLDMSLARSVVAVNDTQIGVVIDKARSVLGDLRGRRCAVLGVAFKPDTDDVRDAPAVALIRALVGESASVVAHDPLVRWLAMYSSLPAESFSFADDPYSAAVDCDLVILMTEWSEYRQLDLEQLLASCSSRTILDARNLWSGRPMPDGVHYVGIGCGERPAPVSAIAAHG